MTCACPDTPLAPPVSGDATALIQAALDTAALTTGVVRLLPGLYPVAGALSIPAGAALQGTSQGPFEPLHVMTATPKAATLLLTGVGSGIALMGYGSSLSDVLIHYPNQVAPTALAPITTYPPAIVMSAPSSVRRITITNALDGMRVHCGRCSIHDSNIGAMRYGITVDGPQDWVDIANIVQSVWWDIEAGLPHPQPIDAWVMGNSIGLNTGRADSLHVRGMLVFRRRGGISFGVGPTGSGYGSFSDIDLDGVQYGVVAHSLAPPGAMFSNLNVAAAAGMGQTAFFYMAGGPAQPRLFLSNVITRGTWAYGWNAGWPAGRLHLANVVAI
jgi:hypothetical protein